MGADPHVVPQAFFDWSVPQGLVDTSVPQGLSEDYTLTNHALKTTGDNGSLTPILLNHVSFQSAQKG